MLKQLSGFRIPPYPAFGRHSTAMKTVMRSLDDETRLTGLVADWSIRLLDLDFSKKSRSGGEIPVGTM